MCHVEDSYKWTPPLGGPQAADPTAKALAQLATVVGTAVIQRGGYGAKVSVQFGRNFLDQNYSGVGLSTRYPGGPTSLHLVLFNGGNFWNHTHDKSYANLSSNWTTVASAYGSEKFGGALQSPSYDATAGRSAGADINDSTVDWASIAVYAGIKRINSNAVNYYACTPESLRPYGMTARDINDGVYYHDVAPGPLYTGAPTTLRQRPFWVNSASQWDANINCIYPSEVTVGSLLMIPHPSRFRLSEMSEGRNPVSGTVNTITIQDLDAGLTDVWSTYKQMELYQSSISNVWYVQINPNLLYDTNTGVVRSVVASMGVWIDSINALVSVPNSAVWMNMNEIASHYVNTTSAWW